MEKSRPRHSFISREAQLKSLGEGLLNPMPIDERKCKLVYGPKECGKTALLKEHCKLMERASSPLVWTFLDELSATNAYDFVSALLFEVETNWPELKPFVAAISNFEVTSGLSDEEVFQSFAKALEDYFLQPEEQENRPELADLKFVLLLESIDEVSAPLIDLFRTFRNAIIANPSLRERHQFIFSANNKTKGSENIMSFFSGGVYLDEILVPPFVPSETSAFLEQFDVEPAKRESVHRETGGVPSALLKFCAKYEGIETADTKEIRKAEELIAGLGVEQREWLKIAALLEECDPEKMSLFLSPEQSQMATNWLSSQAAHFISFNGSTPIIRKEECEALRKLQKKENSRVYSKRMKRVKDLNNVRRYIPKYEHRQLMVHLDIFDNFDRSLLERTLGPATAARCWDFVENKAVYFSSFEDSYRLSHNARLIIGLYTQLFPVKNIAEVRGKAKALWKKRKQEIDESIEAEEAKIKKNEVVRDEVSGTIEAIDKQIAQTGHSFSQVKDNQAGTIVEMRKSRTGLIALALQIFGIVALYIGVLFKENIIVPVLALATVLLAVGFTLALRKRGNEKVTRKRIVTHHEQKKRLSSHLEKLKSEKLTHAIRRDHAKKAIAESKEMIEIYQRLLSRPYLKG